MNLSTAEKIKIILGRRKMPASALADKLGSSRQNLSNKLTRNNFSEKELQDIATALDCTYTVTFTLNDTGETI